MHVDVDRGGRRGPTRGGGLGVVVAALVLGLLGTGCEPVSGDPADRARPPAPRPTATPGPDDTAAAVLASLPVKGRAPMTGYGRDRFGQSWLDADRNGCDTRNDMLNRDLVDVEHKAGTGGCLVLAGSLADPYTGASSGFVHGDGALVDVDHVVALGNAWATGAFGWDIRRRAAFANDPLNLLAVDASTNRQKGDGDAATWLPPHRDFRCEYVARQVAVKAKYGLWVTSPERDAITGILASCPGQGLPLDPSAAPVAVDQDLRDPGEPVTHEAPAAPAEAAGEDVYFENCDAARAAGAVPVRRGDPGYGTHLDGDGDGSACE